MSKKMLLALSVLSGACGASDVVDESAVVVATPTETTEQQEPLASQTSAEPTHTELPDVRISTGPVSVIPSSAVTEENIGDLAEKAVEALKQTVSDAMEQGGAHAEEEIEEALVKQGQSFIDFLISNFNSFVEYLKNGWKYMVYNSVGGATRSIVESAATRSIVLDLSSLQAVDAHAAKCLENMAAARAVILAAAEARSPEIKTAAEACLSQYEAWFTGNSRAFVGDENTTIMLQALGLSKIGCRSFNLQNLHNFSKLGGEACHRGLFFAVSPSESSGLLARSADEAPVASDETGEPAKQEDDSVIADDSSAADASKEELREEISELMEEIKELKEEVDTLEELLVEELIVEEVLAEELAQQAKGQAESQADVVPVPDAASDENGSAA
jgi:hypothetical protein